MLLLTISFFVFSCGQNDTKQKELELKERELALKEKELELKQKNNSSGKVSLTPTTATTKSNPNNAATSSNSNPPTEIAIIKEITTTKGKYPIVELSNKQIADEINAYISKQLFNKAYSQSDVKKFIEIEGWDKNNYANYAEVTTKVITNTPKKIVLAVGSCVSGAGLVCGLWIFTINPSTGKKSVKIES